MNPFLTSILIFIFATISISASSQANLSKGLVAYYPFNGNANDESGNDHNPVFNNAALTKDRFGNKKSAYSFNGRSSYMRIKNTPLLSPSELTIVAIVKPTGFYMGTCYNNSIVDKGAWDYHEGNYSLRFTAGEYTKGDCYNAALAFQNFVGMSARNGGPTSKNLYIKLNSWYCVVYTVGKQYSTLYVDGKLISTIKTSEPIGKNNEDIFIGKKNNSQYPYWFNGIMDEVRIYNRALSKAEIALLCNKNTTKKIAELPCDGMSTVSAKFTHTISDCMASTFQLSKLKPENLKKIEWKFGDGTTSSQISPQHTYRKPGKYKVTAITTNSKNCTDTFSTVIEIKELNTDFIVTEKGKPGELFFSAGNNKANYSWNFGDGTSVVNSSATTHFFEKTGNYNVKLFSKNNNGCTDTVQKEVSIILPEKTIPVANITQEENKIEKVYPILLEERKKDIVTGIITENDSITVFVYDNGIIDGDSITLLYNNKIILSNQLLKSSPVVLKIKIEAERSNNELVMYANNQGSIPPNTALLIIYDGEKKYEVNVSSTKKANGVIQFTSKKYNSTL